MAQKSVKKQSTKKNSSDLGQWILTVLVLMTIWFVTLGMFGFTVLMFYDSWGKGIWFYVASLSYVILLMWLLPFWVVYQMAPKYKKIIALCFSIALSWFPLYIIFLN